MNRVNGPPKPSAIDDQPPPSVAALLALHDDAFVRAAYLSVLGREVDPDGLNNYLAQVRTGQAKAQIVAELARSSEAQGRAAKIAGLQAVLASPARPAHSIWARLFKRLTAAAMEPLLRQLRIIDNTAAQLDVTLRRQATQLAEIARLLEQNRAAPAATAGLAAGAPAQAERKVQLLRVAPAQRQLFSELKAAIAVKRGH